MCTILARLLLFIDTYEPRTVTYVSISIVSRDGETRAIMCFVSNYHLNQ